MKKIKVYIMASPHPQFDEILNFPPEDVEYKINRVKTKYHSWFTEHKIMLHRILMNLLPIPRMMRAKVGKDTDLIHSTRGILQIKPKKPWIVDLECGHVFTSFNWKAMKNPIVKRMIINSLSSKKCKKILPQSEAANKTFHMAIDCSKFEDKIEVLYLAMRPCKKKKIKRKDNRVILSFVGRGFYGKGAHDLLKAYEILTKKYSNLELKFKGEIPQEYKDMEKLKGLKLIKGFLSRDKLFEEMYLSSDIFVLPTHQDNYGVVFLEAMSAGIPIVGTENMTVSELIEDGKNGFLIKSPYSWENYLPKGKNWKDIQRDWRKVHPKIVKQLVEKLSILIEDKKLREKMGKESRRMIEEGKFSIKERNKKLSKIYKEGIK
jgi:glycosyltransferase involved in cell wall biosynthesis